MKTVKTTLTLIALLIASVSYAQNSLYNKYSSSPHVSATYISKAMLEMQPNVNTMGDIYLGKISGQMEGVYILQTSENSVRTSLQNDIDKYIKQEKYELLMEQKKSPGNTSAYYIKRKNKEEIKELIMITDRSARTSSGTEKSARLKFVLLVGNMTVKDIQQIIMFGDAQIPMLQMSTYLADAGDVTRSALEGLKSLDFSNFQFPVVDLKDFNFQDFDLKDFKMPEINLNIDSIGDVMKKRIQDWQDKQN